MATIMAVDAGFACCGAAILGQGESGRWDLLETAAIRTEKADKKRALRRADDDFDRCQHIAAGLWNLARKHNVKRLVVELPHGGAQNATAAKCMGMAAAIVAAVAAIGDMAVEAYTPAETRIAGGGRKTASKDDVIAVMSAAYPALAEVQPRQSQEAVADALATFQAAMGGALTRL